jgi:hypothetical protein
MSLVVRMEHRPFPCDALGCFDRYGELVLNRHKHLHEELAAMDTFPTSRTDASSPGALYDPDND